MVEPRVGEVIELSNFKMFPYRFSLHFCSF
jgi:hypothetical protein